MQHQICCTSVCKCIFLTTERQKQQWSRS